MSDGELTIEKLDESSGLCECCGTMSRSVWGLVHRRDKTAAAYWMHWTVGHLEENGANLDLVMGEWGEDASPEKRAVVALEHRQRPDGSPALMVIDSASRPVATSDLAKAALSRSDVISSPLAQQVFAITDAIYSQDERFF